MRSSDAQNTPQAMEIGRRRKSPTTTRSVFRDPCVCVSYQCHSDGFSYEPRCSPSGGPYYASLIGCAARRDVVEITQRISTASKRF